LGTTNGSIQTLKWRRKEGEEAVCPIKGKVQQQEKVKRLELACSNWEKIQEYCRVENMLEDAQLLELG